MVKRARGARAPVAALLVRSISNSDLPMLTTTRSVVLSCFLDLRGCEGIFCVVGSSVASETEDSA